jgi:uncharacterized protein (DUF2267 family)
MAVFSRFQSEEKQLESAADSYNKSISKYLPNRVTALGHGWATLDWGSKWSANEVLGKFHSKYGAGNVEKLSDALRSEKADVDDVGKVYLSYFVPDEQALQASNGKPSFMQHAKLLTDAMSDFVVNSGRPWQARYMTPFVLKMMRDKLCPEDIELYADELQSICLTVMEANKNDSIYNLAECAQLLCGALEDYPEQKNVIISQYMAHLSNTSQPLSSGCISRFENMDDVLSEGDKAQVNAILADKLKNLLAALPDNKDAELNVEERCWLEAAEVSQRMVSFFARDPKGQCLSKSFNKLVDISELTVVSREDKLLAAQLTTFHSGGGPTYVLKTDLRTVFTEAEAERQTVVSYDYKVTLEETHGEMGKALARKLATQTHIIK